MSVHEDIRSRKVAFVPFCLLCRASQADGLVKDSPSHDAPVVEALLSRDVNLVQMPCPEAEFAGFDRKPNGFDWYDRPEFRELCDRLADDTVTRMKDFTGKGYDVRVVLGVEYSPSCAVRNQYMGRKGTVRREGLFMEALHRKMSDAGLDVPVLGINRRGLKSTIIRLEEIIG